MLLNNLFIDNPINFEKRCKTRIIASCLLLVLGAVTIALSFLAGDHIPVLYMTADHYDFIPGFYMGTGFGLLFAAIATIIKNVRYLKKPDLKKEREIYETDERNRMLGCAAGLTQVTPCCSYFTSESWSAVSSVSLYLRHSW